MMIFLRDLFLKWLVLLYYQRKVSVNIIENMNIDVLFERKYMICMQNL